MRRVADVAVNRLLTGYLFARDSRHWTVFRDRDFDHAMIGRNRQDEFNLLVPVFMVSFSR